MAVGLDDIQTELADLDIEVDACPYQIDWCGSINYFARGRLQKIISFGVKCRKLFMMRC